MEKICEGERVSNVPIWKAFLQKIFYSPIPFCCSMSLYCCTFSLSFQLLNIRINNEQIKNFIFFNGFKSEQAAKKEEDDNSMNNLLDSMVDGAFLSNDRGEIVLFNKAAQKVCDLFDNFLTMQ